MSAGHPAPVAPAPGLRLPPHMRRLPLRVGTRASPLALVQTRAFLATLRHYCPVLRTMDVFEEHPIRTTGDTVQDRALAEIGGKGLFAKEIHEALADGRVDFAVHSLKDLETTLPPGIVLACVLPREDARDALILPPGRTPVASGDPYAGLVRGARIGTSSVRRQAQLLHARPDLRVSLLRGNVQTRLEKLARGVCDGSLLAIAGLRRLGLETVATAILDPETMVPSAGQGMVGVTVREADADLRLMLAGIEDWRAARIAAAERALLATLDGSCRTPIGGYAILTPDPAEPGRTTRLRLTGLVARVDGSFLLKRTIEGGVEDGCRLGVELAQALRRDSPADLFET